MLKGAVTKMMYIEATNQPVSQGLLGADMEVVGGRTGIRSAAPSSGTMKPYPNIVVKCPPMNLPALLGFDREVDKHFIVFGIKVEVYREGRSSGSVVAANCLVEFRGMATVRSKLELASYRVPYMY